MPDGSVQALTVGIGALAATEARLFEIVGGWVVDAHDPALAVHLATVSRELGEHATWWHAILPESVLLDPAAALRPAPRWAALLDALGAVTDDAGRAVALQLVVLPGLGEAVRALPGEERFVRRVRERVLADLAEALFTGSSCASRLAGSPAGAGAAAAALATLGPAFHAPHQAR